MIIDRIERRTLFDGTYVPSICRDAHDRRDLGYWTGRMAQPVPDRCETMTDTMKNNTVVDSVLLSPNPIDSGEAFLIDVQARNRTTWGDYSADTWSGVSSLIWG